MTSLTQEQRDKNTHEYFKAFAQAQQERNRLIHEARVAGSPWLSQVRAMQIKLQEEKKGSN
jgi:hypothetical protein